MEVSEQLQLKGGEAVRVTNKSRLDHAFEGKCGVVVNPLTSNGYIRIRLDGFPLTATVLVHPESVELA